MRVCIGPCAALPGGAGGLWVSRTVSFWSSRWVSRRGSVSDLVLLYQVGRVVFGFIFSYLDGSLGGYLDVSLDGSLDVGLYLVGMGSLSDLVLLHQVGFHAEVY
jgi:hypothetical protein